MRRVAAGIGRWLERTAASRARRAVVLVTAFAVGIAGAATVAAFAAPQFGIVHGYGPHGDGRTRLLVTAPGGLDDVALATLRHAPHVDSAQRLFTGAVLVAGFGITPGELTAQVPGATVTTSPTGQVAGAPMNDPYWSYDGANLANNGSNADSRVEATPIAGDDINAPAGWAASTGRGQVVAVLDTGLANHVDLAGALWTNPEETCGSTDTDRDGYAGDCHGWNFYAGTADVTNAGGDASHGTAVAGTVGARANNAEGLAGTAPDVTIMPLVVGSGEDVDLSAAAQAIVYAADHGATVINGSWGGPGGADMLAQAIAYANTKGALVVVAAGNDNADRAAVPFYPASLHAPNLIVVGASTPADTKASFSAYGATTVDLFAPGNLIFSPWWRGGYMLFDGTSLASPEVAGAAALYRAVYPNDTPAQLKARILGDVTLVPGLAGKSITGGRLSLTALGNTAAAVSYVFSGMNSTPGTVSPTVVAGGSAPAGDYAVQLGLGMQFNGLVYALADQPITLNGQTLATGDDGTATFDLGVQPPLGSQVLTPSTTLADGQYVLTAQLLVDGSPVGRTFAAPMLVSDTPVPSTPTPGTPDPSGPQPDGSQPDSSQPDGSQPPSTDPGSSQPGSTDPGSSQPPSTDPSSNQPGSTDPGNSQPPSTDPGSSQPPSTDPSSNQPGSTDPGNSQPPSTDPGSSQPGSTDPSGTQPGSTDPGNSQPPSTDPSGTQPGSTDPGSSQPPSTDPGSSQPGGGSQPGSTDPGSSQPPSTDPGSSQPGGGSQPGSTDPGPGGQQDYPGNDVFGLTSISPTRVTTAGGTLVTITGTAVPAGVRIRVGASAAAQVITASSTRVTFLAPALVAGTYDVFVFAPDGTSAVLSGGLTYLDSSGGSQPGTGSPPGSSDPGAGSPPDSQPDGSQPDGSQPGSGPQPDDSLVGPHGEHLRYSARFAALGPAIWGVNCVSSCSGLPM